MNSVDIKTVKNRIQETEKKLREIKSRLRSNDYVVTSTDRRYVITNIGKGMNGGMVGICPNDIPKIFARLKDAQYTVWNLKCQTSDGGFLPLTYEPAKLYIKDALKTLGAAKDTLLNLAAGAGTYV